MRKKISTNIGNSVLRASRIVFLISLIVQCGLAEETVTTVVERITTTREKQEKKEIVPDEFEQVAAIFVANRAGKAFNDEVMLVEDLIVSQVSDLGFVTLSREVVMDALSGYGGGKSDVATELDKRLLENTSALALARNLGASHIISVSIGSFARNKKQFRDTDGSYGGISTDVSQYVLRVPYKILDATRGGSLTADTIKVSKTIRQTDGLVIEEGDLLNDLLDEASQQIASSLEKRIKQGRIKDSAQLAERVDLTVHCGMTDLSIPDVKKQEDGSYQIVANAYKLEPMSVTVEIDGMVVGTAPGTFPVRPGISKIRLSREGFKEWARTINVYDGQVLNVSLQMDEAGYDRWRENISFLQNQKDGAVITEAQAELIRGKAKEFEQSGMRIDYRIDADKAPDVEIHEKSLIR